MRAISFAHATATFILAIVAVAAPSSRFEERNSPSPPSSCCNVAFNDAFDDRKASGVSVSPITSVGNYGALFNKTFQLAGSGATSLIQPPSTPNFIFAGLAGQVTTGQPQFLLPNDTVKSFDLKKTNYACTANSGAKATSCTIQIAGVKKDGGATVIKELVYDPPLVPAGLANTFSEMTFPSPDFDGLKEVTVSIISSALTTGLTNVLFDNVRYNACIAK